jgi:hypothetical protein
MPGLREVLGIAPVSLIAWMAVALIAVTLLGFMEVWKATRRWIEAKSATPAPPSGGRIPGRTEGIP